MVSSGVIVGEIYESSVAFCEATAISDPDSVLSIDKDQLDDVELIIGAIRSELEELSVVHESVSGTLILGAVYH